MCHVRAVSSLRKVFSDDFFAGDGKFDLAWVKELGKVRIMMCCCAGVGSAAAGSGGGGAKEADGS